MFMVCVFKWMYIWTLRKQINTKAVFFFFISACRSCGMKRTCTIKVYTTMNISRFRPANIDSLDNSFRIPDDQTTMDRDLELLKLVL